jgi:hypothetical protein
MPPRFACGRGGVRDRRRSSVPYATWSRSKARYPGSPGSRIAARPMLCGGSASREQERKGCKARCVSHGFSDWVLALAHADPQTLRSRGRVLLGYILLWGVADSCPKKLLAEDLSERSRRSRAERSEALGRRHRAAPSWPACACGKAQANVAGQAPWANTKAGRCTPQVASALLAANLAVRGSSPIQLHFSRANWQLSRLPPQISCLPPLSPIKAHADAPGLAAPPFLHQIQDIRLS